MRALYKIYLIQYTIVWLHWTFDYTVHRKFHVKPYSFGNICIWCRPCRCNFQYLVQEHQKLFVPGFLQGSHPPEWKLEPMANTHTMAEWALFSSTFSRRHRKAIWTLLETYNFQYKHTHQCRDILSTYRHSHIQIFFA